MVVGDTSSGKSSLLRAILAAWRWSVVLLDPKRLEFGNWPENGRVLNSTGDPYRIAQLLRQWADEVDSRMDALSRVYATHWTDPEAEPLGLKPVLIVLDEAMVALTRPAREEAEKETKIRTEGARQALLECLVLGRASGVHVVVGLQRPDASFLGGGAARDQLRARIALGRLSPDGCRMMFDADLSDQMDGRPGFGLAVNLSSAMPTPVLFRSAWISPRDIRALYASGPERE
jgi:S-DNA-T family DNA segregation ATPase FtsK/SpoIIIE